MKTYNAMFRITVKVELVFKFEVPDLQRLTSPALVLSPDTCTPHPPVSALLLSL